MKKFELVPEMTRVVFGTTLFRIRALISFGDVNKGDPGGWLETERNLSQEGDAWVSGNAQVYGEAVIYGNAQVYGNALVFDGARVSGDARVYGSACIYGNAQIYDDAEVYGEAWVYDNAQVYGGAEVYDGAGIYGEARIYGDAEIFGNAQLYGTAQVSRNTHWLISGPVGSERGILTAFRQRDNSVQVNRGCFSGTLDEFKKDVNKNHGNNRYGREYRALIEFIRLRLDDVDMSESQPVRAGTMIPVAGEVSRG